MPTSTTSYPILDPAHPLPARAAQCALAVMVKAPTPGKVKTRLSPPLTPQQAADINICFLRDTTENIATVTASGQSAGIISYTPIGDEALFDNLLPTNFALIPQRGEDFGERLLATTQDLLACGYGSVCLIDSDSPTVPAAAFQQAVAELARPGDRLVLGPAHDGGYYLIGLKQPHPELFASIHWSTSTVFTETLAAAKATNIETVTLPLWYDVDDGTTLEILTAELLDNTPPPFTSIPGHAAEHTRVFLRNLRQQGSATP
jgi:rSAM/selenodomain-associated transferase 1